MFFICCFPLLGFSLVDVGSTYVIPHSLGLCENSGEYVVAGFQTNFEVNSDQFQIQRSQDAGFSWAINVGSPINGCGTCGSRNYSVTDYGPFAPGVWYYRVKATSNSLNFSYHSLGSYTPPSGPSTPDWKYQVPGALVLGSTSNDPNSYSWAQESSIMQGCGINLSPTEITDIYIQQNNAKINFDLSPVDLIIDLQANVDNGGYFTLYNGSPVTSYLWNSPGSLISTLGNHNLKIKFTTASSTIFFREYNVHICASSTELHKSNTCDVLRLYHDPSNPNPIPIVVSEGFDSYNATTPEFYRFAGDALFSCMISKGFKVYVLNYKFNSQDMRNNAAIFASAVRYVSAINGNQPVIAGGISMGGVIARYALAKAEDNGTPLPAYKFVSMDSPHQGAIISKALQDFKWDQQHTSANSSILLHSLNNPAAKELLINNTFENGQAAGLNYTSPNLTHTSFFTELDGLNGNGYPHLTENIGVSFSDANPHGYLNQQWLRIDLNNTFYSALVQNFSIEAEEDEAGSYLPLPSTQTDPATSGLLWYLNFLVVTQPFNYADVTFTRYLNPTFIPHKSSLDIVGSISKFDKTISTSSTSFHDVVPPDIVEPLINALLKDNIYVQNRVFNSIYNLVAQKNIFAGYNVTGSVPLGNVDVNSGADVTFRAGQQIQMDPGFNVNSGAQFTAIIDIAHCDGTTEYQNRMIHTNTLSPVAAKQNSPDNISSEIKLFPNPVNDVLMIKTSSDISGIEVFNIYGQKMDIKCNSKTQVDLSSLSAGTYFVKITTGDTVKTTSVIKQ